jgi:hypothetical protein
MKNNFENLISKAYAAFNARDIDAALSTFHPNVEWPKAFEGGYVNGHDEIRKYWTRQWAEINPIVTPIEITKMEDDKVVVKIHQIVKDLDGHILFNGIVKHIYTIENSLLRKMDIELPENK